MSKVSRWLRCQRSWALNYYFKAKTTKESLPMLAGREFASCRAKIDLGKPYLITDALKDPAERAKLEVVLAAYQREPSRAVTSEVEVRRVIDWLQIHNPTGPAAPNELVMIGYLDGINQDRTRIDEWKYTENPLMYDILKVNLQASMYFAAVPTAKEFVLCAARRPKEEILEATPEDKRKFTQEKVCACVKKQGKGKEPLPPVADCPDCKGAGKIPSRLYAGQRERPETIEEYKARILSNLGVTGSFFSYTSFLRSEFDIDGNLRLVARAHRAYTAAIKAGEFYPNYNSCEMCEWHDWCEEHPGGQACSRPPEECPMPLVCARIKVTNELRASERK